MTNFDQTTFDQQVLNAELPVVVDFYADWCRPCQMLAPVLEKLAREFDGKVLFGKVDIDVNQALAQDQGLSSLPTVMIFKKGKVVGRIVGLAGEAKIKTEIENALL